MENYKYLASTKQSGNLQAVNNFGEPFLSNLNLYHSINDNGADEDRFGPLKSFKNNLLQFLNNADGTNPPEILQSQFNINNDTLEILIKYKILKIN